MACAPLGCRSPGGALSFTPRPKDRQQRGNLPKRLSGRCGESQRGLKEVGGTCLPQAAKGPGEMGALRWPCVRAMSITGALAVTGAWAKAGWVEVGGRARCSGEFEREQKGGTGAQRQAGSLGRFAVGVQRRGQPLEGTRMETKGLVLTACYIKMGRMQKRRKTDDAGEGPVRGSAAEQWGQLSLARSPWAQREGEGEWAPCRQGGGRGNKALKGSSLSCSTCSRK